ncbi:MAG: amino acid racemase [Lentimicrobium sp.]|nr:amino acid racemase [Lentimicrobium sp.]
MKKIGIIGGTGPEATVDYYKEIINAFKDGSGDMNYPEIIIYSINLGKLMGMMRAKQYEEAIAYLVEKIACLEKAGAEFAAISANTPHLFFDQIKSLSPIPLISIVEATLAETIKRGLKRPGLIGTGFTMDASFYADNFRLKSIEVVVPDREDRELINYKLFSEIELGIFKDETRQLLIRIIEKMVRAQQIDSLILGCTEFPLILTEPEYAGIPMLNTTRIHVDAIVGYCMNEEI